LAAFFADCFAGFLCCLTVFAARGFLATAFLAAFLAAGVFAFFAFLAVALAAAFFAFLPSLPSSSFSVSRLVLLLSSRTF
jgi:hypothetical protein